MRKKIIIRKKLTSFFETAKDLKKKNKLKAQKSGLDNLSRTFLSSLIIISIFFIAIKKIDIMIKLDKKVLERLSSPLFCAFSLFFFFKSFAVSKNDVSFFLIIIFFLITILQPLL